MTEEYSIREEEWITNEEIRESPIVDVMENENSAFEAHDEEIQKNNEIEESTMDDLNIELIEEGQFDEVKLSVLERVQNIMDEFMEAYKNNYKESVEILKSVHELKLEQQEKYNRMVEEKHRLAENVSHLIQLQQRWTA